MTKLKIKPSSTTNPVGSDYDFDNIFAGDMFHCYDSDVTIMAVQNTEIIEYRFVRLDTGCFITEEDDDYFEDVFERLTALYGNFYPISKAKLTFTVGD